MQHKAWVFSAAPARVVDRHNKRLPIPQKNHRTSTYYHSMQFVLYNLVGLAGWYSTYHLFLLFQVLYHELGYTKYDIGVLFIAGFGSSAVFGSFIGGMADTKGRRLFVVVYGAAYALSCVTKRTCDTLLLLCLCLMI